MAFEFEYRFLNEKLGVYTKAGAASGDPDVVGLSQYEDLVTQPGRQEDDFYVLVQPNYQIDLILFKEILGRISGAYYFAPRSATTSFGPTSVACSELGWTSSTAARCSSSRRTRRSRISVRSSICRSTTARKTVRASRDGFYAAFQYGVLFPLNGLKYLEIDGVREPDAPQDISVKNAQTWRLILGIEF